MMSTQTASPAAPVRQDWLDRRGNDRRNALDVLRLLGGQLAFQLLDQGAAELV